MANALYVSIIPVPAYCISPESLYLLCTVIIYSAVYMWKIYLAFLSLITFDQLFLHSSVVSTST